MGGFDAFGLFLAIGMCVTGSLNTLSAKLANQTSARGLFGYYQFNHPFLQTATMFAGESLCLVAYSLLLWRAKRTGRSIDRANNDFPFYIFILPALCDLTATSVMSVGLVYTYASVFQMMRGSVVIFTGIFSWLFLGRRLSSYKILGMVLVLGGLACVGSASVISSDGDSSSAPNPLMGAVLVVAAQLVVAGQMVVEEKFIDKYNVPALLVPGFEGLFGLTMMSIVLIVMYYVPHVHGVSNDDAGNHFENSLDAFTQIGNSWVLSLATFGYVLSIAFFNYFGASVTKYMNATTRMVLDNIRTIVIWGADLIIGWDKFQYMQIIGFFFLILGTGIYNRIVPVPIAYFDYRLDPDYIKLVEQADHNNKLQVQNSQIHPNDDQLEASNMVADHHQNGGGGGGSSYKSNLHAPLLDEEAAY